MTLYVCCYLSEHYQVLQLAVQPPFSLWKITELVLVRMAEIYFITVAGGKVKIVLESWREAGAACCQRHTKHTHVVLILVLVRQESSPFSKGRKNYNKMGNFQNLQVVRLYWHSFVCLLVKEGHVNGRALLRADAG